MLVQQSMTYQQLFDELAESLKKVKTTSRMEELWTALGPYLLAAMTESGCKSTFQKDLQGFFDRLVYASVKEEGPYCSKRVNQYFICFDCEVKSEQNSSVYCVSCFVFDKHKGHNFRLIKTKLAVCDCGDPDVLKKSSFCQKHKQVRKEPELDPLKVEEFIKEMQFLLYVLYRLTQVKQDITDQQKKKELFARAYIKKLAKVIEKSYHNKIMLTRFFFSDLLPLKCFHYEQCRTPMRRIMSFKKPTYFDKLSEEVLLPLYTVKEMRQTLLEQYFSIAHSKYSFYLGFSPISKSMFQYTNAEKEVLDAIKKFGPLLIQFDFKKFSTITYQVYMEIFATYQKLLDKSFSLQAAILLMEKLDISKLGQYYIQKLQKTNKNQFYSLELACFEVVFQLVKVLSSADRKEILLKMVKDSFKRIKVKRASPSLAVERMFALAFYSFVDCDIQNILDIDEALMYEIFDQTEEEQLAYVLQQAIKKAFTPLKLDNKTDLKLKVYKALAKKPYIIYSVDLVYVKILTYFLMRIQQPTYQYLLKPLDGFIQSKVKSIETLFDLYMIQQIMKLQDVIQSFFSEMQIIIRNLISISQTSLSEIITTLSLKPQKIKKNEIFDFFQFLVYVYDPASVKQFRQHAKRYTENDKIIEQFVRTAYNRYKAQSSKGVLPRNNFNISFNSYYLPFKSFKEFTTVYQLKIRKYTRTEISRFIFSYAMLDKVYSSLEYVMEKVNSIGLDEYMTSFKQMIGSVAQLCILLALETKHEKFDEMALRCIAEYKKAFSKKTTSYENAQNEDYYKNLFKMYEDTRQKLLQQKKQKIPTKDTNDKLDKNLRERAALKMKKINQLKQRQRSILASKSGSMELPQQGKQSAHVCTICKDSANKEELYYLCHTRFSNFIKSTKTKIKRTNKQIEDPILVTSTCGHEVHLKCLKQSLRINDQIMNEQFEFQCFLCKTYSNSIVPIYSNQAIQQKQKEKYISKLANFVLFLMQEGYSTSKIIDYDRFNIQQILLNSITQEIYWYGTQLPKYFIMKLLPVIRQQLHLIAPTQSTQYESKIKCEISQLFKKLKALTEIDEEALLMWVKLGILLTITEPNVNEEDSSAVKIQRIIKVPEAYQSEFEKMLVVMKELQTNKPMNSYDLITKFQIKDKQDIFFELPQDLVKLNEQIGKCPSCTKVTSKMLICFTCGYKVCQSCTAMIVKHVSKHLDCCIFIRVELGDCHVYWEQSRTQSKSLYLDYAGEPLDDRSKCPQRQTFLLSKEFYNELSTLLIGDMIPNDLQFHRHGICQVQ